MRYAKKPKYKLTKDKLRFKMEKDLTPEELYQELLKSKIRKKRR